MDLNLRNEVAPDENEEVPPNNAASDLGTDNRDDLVDGDDGDEGDDDERAAATAAETIAEKLSKLAGEEGDGLSAAALRHQLSKAELKELSAAFNVLARDKAAQHQRGNQGRFKDQGKNARTEAAKQRRTQRDAVKGVRTALMRATDVLTAGGTTVHAFYVLYAVGPGGGKPVEDQLVVPGSSCLAQPSFTSSVPYKAALEQAGEKSGAEVLLHLLQSDMAAGTGQ